MKISFTKNMKILIAIILLGIILRVAFINSSPPALYGDELTITLDSYSLLKTGHDQLGNLLPLTFQMGAGRPAGYVYGSIPFVAIFGPTAIGIRALSILSGIGILLLLYFLGKQFFSEKIGLIASSIGAVSPWDISLSRGGFEAHFALFLVLLGLYLFLLAREKPIFYFLSAICFGLTWHTYPTYKLSLLFFLPILLWYRNGIRKAFYESRKFFFSGILILVILGGLSLSQTFIGGSEIRFADINIFSQSQLKDLIEQKINFERQITALPLSISKLFHNKPVEYFKVFTENYLQNFSVDFLIIHGDRSPRHNMATMGELYAAEIILILVGFLNFWQKEKKTILFFLFWILLAPISTAIIDLPHALRSSFMLPPLIFLSAMGLERIISNRNKFLLFLVFLIFITQFIFFIQKLFFLAPVEYSNFWSYPAKLASQIAIQNKNKYKYIILSDRIDNLEFAYPVYANIDPLVVISQNKQKSILESLEFKKFDNIYIGSIPNGRIQEFIHNLDGSALYIDNPDAVKFLTIYETIVGKDGTVSLAISRISK